MNQVQATPYREQPRKLTPSVEKAELASILKQTREVRGVKNLNEHLNCTKQECGSPWS